MEKKDTELLVVPLSKLARVPQRATEGSAGYDLYSTVECDIPAHALTTISTDIAIILPPNTCGQIWARSGMAKKGIRVGGGLIDSDYRGAIGVILHNDGESPYHISIADRIAQLVIVPIFTPVIVTHDTLDKSDHTGFGSTGV